MTAADGTRLAGWWLDRPGSERVIVLPRAPGQQVGPAKPRAGLWRARNSVLLLRSAATATARTGYSPWRRYEQADLEAAIAHAAVVRRRPDAAPLPSSVFPRARPWPSRRRAGPAGPGVRPRLPFADMRGVPSPMPPLGCRFRRSLLLCLVDHATETALWLYRFRDVTPLEASAPSLPAGPAPAGEDRVIPIDHAHRLYACGRQTRSNRSPSPGQTAVRLLPGPPAYVASSPTSSPGRRVPLTTVESFAAASIAKPVR